VWAIPAAVVNASQRKSAKDTLAAMQALDISQSLMWATPASQKGARQSLTKKLLKL
jgi:hypothetical protein